MGNEEFNVITIGITSLLLGLILSLVVKGVNFLQVETEDTFSCSLLFAFGFGSCIVLYLYAIFKLNELGLV